MNGNTIRTFLGTNSGSGFRSLQENFLSEDPVYIIKGGPGSGKSGLMKKIAEKASGKGYFTEYVYCSSDPNSLDGIRIPELGLCMVDGTPPHTAEPKFPGARDRLINTGEFWSGTTLRKNRDEIEELSGEIKHTFAKAYTHLSSAQNAVAELRQTVLRKTDKSAIRNLARGFLRRYRNVCPEEGVLRPRFLSAFTPQGNTVFRDTVYTLADHVFVLNDPYRLSDLFLDEIARYAQDYRTEAYLFFDPLEPDRLRHIVLPGENIGFVSSEKSLPFEPQEGYRINLRRFTETDDEIRKVSRDAEHVRRAETGKATELLRREKELHDELEDYYVEAMDFRKLNRYAEKLISEIFGSGI